MRIRWKDAALADLQEMAEYIAAENPAAARRVLAELRNQARALADHPYLGRAGRVAGTRELVVTKYPYVIAYEVTERAVSILAVVHTSRLWPQDFRSD